MKKRSRWFIAVLFAMIMAGGLLAAVLWQRYQSFAHQPLTIQASDPVLSVEQGDSFPQVLKKIRKLGIHEGSDLEWRALARKKDVASRMQVGDYELTKDITPDKLLGKIKFGDVLQYRITLIEGKTFREWRKTLAADKNLKQTITTLSDQEIMQKLHRKGVHPEGRFLPETYLYTRNTTDLDILFQAMYAMNDALDEAWAQRDTETPLKSQDELLTLASIVEKETGKASERPEIAGVFIRRLNLGMRLQTDPTVIYGMGTAYNGNIRKKDLLEATPYNTYVIFGLPPTPIAMPGKEALQAAARPAEGETLFFVARGDGSHYFSKTYDEHRAAVEKYQLGKQ
jgi:UPF0755 protein